MSSPIRRVLVAEDVDGKFADLSKVISETISPDECVRARNLNDAEDLVMNEAWGLLILDLSMDISASGSMDLGSGHATLAGIDVVERIALLKMNLPVVIVTGFDSFQDPDRFDNDIMYIRDVDSLVRGLLGNCHLGVIRYGRDDWREELISVLSAWENT
ncbi:hypothetical protein NKH63_19980 [Mesorhizobium sp. M0960]|uniref:hypothetical protein n=1 Tax=Mesorhizobium sp. M0960 TaxID=2957035 RepID=UPI00333B58FC